MRDDARDPIDAVVEALRSAPACEGHTGWFPAVSYVHFPPLGPSQCTCARNVAAAVLDALRAMPPEQAARLVGVAAMAPSFNEGFPPRAYIVRAPLAPERAP